LIPCRGHAKNGWDTNEGTERNSFNLDAPKQEGGKKDHRYIWKDVWILGPKTVWKIVTRGQKNQRFGVQ